MALPVTSSVPFSPCVRECCLDDDDICMGCYRSLEEIKAWQSFTDNQRDAVLQCCKVRRKARESALERYLRGLDGGVGS